MHQTFLVNRTEMYSNPKTAERILNEHQVILDAILKGTLKPPGKGCCSI